MSMWPVNNFHIQILVLELIFCWHLPHRRGFWLRLAGLGAIYCALPFVVPGGYFSPYVTVGWLTLGFLIMLVLSALVLWACFRMRFKQIVFYCCAAHTFQHMVHCLSRVVALTFLRSMPAAQGAELLFFILAALLAHLLVRRQLRGSETVDIRSTYLLVFASVSTLLVYFVSYWTTSQETETVGGQLFDLMCCAMLMVILLDMFRYRRAERNELIMSRLLRQEQEQHRMSAATVEVINRKCHDLKHQISALRRMEDPEEQERSIRELEKAVMIYDSFAKTGNPDLDIILAEKSLVCEQEGIRLQCIADGARLDFLKTEDLYSIFGNALDNAIEGVGGDLPEGKRIITLIIAAKGDLVTVHIENPCEREPLFMDGLPVTTKADRDFHGFGMKSMRYVAEKYGGALSTSWEEGVFSLDILFPR